MSNEIASQRILTLSTVTQGKIRLDRVQKVDPKSEKKTENVMEIGNDDGAGFKDTPGGETVDLELLEQQGKSKPDWDALKANKETVTLTDQIVGGRRFQYGPGRVSTVSRSGDKGGDHTVSVSLTFNKKKVIS